MRKLWKGNSTRYISHRSTCIRLHIDTYIYRETEKGGGGRNENIDREIEMDLCL